MVDFGLVALVVLQVVLVGASGFVLARIIPHYDRIRAVDARIDQALAAVEEARQTAVAVKSTLYEKLRDRVDGFEDERRRDRSQVEKVQEQLVSLAAKYSAMKRWSKAEKADGEGEGELPPLTPPLEEPAVNHRRPSFGRKV